MTNLNHGLYMTQRQRATESGRSVRTAWCRWFLSNSEQVTFCKHSRSEKVPQVAAAHECIGWYLPISCDQPESAVISSSNSGWTARCLFRTPQTKPQTLLRCATLLRQFLGSDVSYACIVVTELKKKANRGPVTLSKKSKSAVLILDTGMLLGCLVLDRHVFTLQRT
jgi:hypothetical protein